MNSCSGANGHTEMEPWRILIVEVGQPTIGVSLLGMFTDPVGFSGEVVVAQATRVKDSLFDQRAYVLPEKEAVDMFGRWFTDDDQVLRSEVIPVRIKPSARGRDHGIFAAHHFNQFIGKEKVLHA